MMEGCVGLEVELQAEQEVVDMETLVQTILVRMYGTIGETQLNYEVRNIGKKKQDNLFKQTAYIKVNKKDKEKVWAALAWYGGNELHKQKFIITQSS